MRRIFLAFCLAPIVGVLLGDIAVCTTLGCGEPTGNQSGPPTIYVLAGALIAYPLAIFFGGPIFWLLWKKKWFFGWIFFALGILLGTLGWAFMLWPFEGPRFEYNVVRFALFGALAGLFGGGSFWAIAIFKNRALTLVGADAQNAARRST